MSKRSYGFTISWPFIIGCYIVYSIFFGSDDDEKKAVDIKTTVNVEQKEVPNKIDETVELIKKEINTSEVIQKAKEEIIKAKEEFMKEAEEVKPEEVPEEIISKETPPPEEMPNLKDEETKEEEPLDNMKPL